MLMIARPTVVFPQPDSPTSPSVSPRPSVNDTPSTAPTAPTCRRSTPPKTGKRTWRSWTSRMESMWSAGIQVTAHDMFRRHLDERGFRVSAGLEALRATRHKLAAGWKMEDVRYVAGNDGEPLRFDTVDARNRAEQPLRI